LQDYLTKPVPPATLVESLRRAGVMPFGARPILIVDDDLTSLKLAEATLKEIGYRSVGARTRDEMLAAAAAEPPSLVVLDWLLPECDGFELISRLRSLPGLRDVPIVIWTVKDLTSTERANLKRAADAVVSKGIG